MRYYFHNVSYSKSGLYLMSGPLIQTSNLDQYPVPGLAKLYTHVASTRYSLSMTTSTDYALLGLTPGTKSSSGVTGRPSNSTTRLGLGFPRTISNDALPAVITTAAGLDGGQLLCLTSAGLLSRSKGRGTLGSGFLWRSYLRTRASFAALAVYTAGGNGSGGLKRLSWSGGGMEYSWLLL
jgi:hypothetical protein